MGTATLLGLKMNTDSGLGSLKSCSKLNLSSYAMPSASPFYTSPFSAMDKPDLVNTSSFLDLWGETSILQPTSYEQITQQEVSNRLDNQTLVGCEPNNNNSTQNIDSRLNYIENPQCSENNHHPVNIVSQSEPYTAIDYSNIGSWTQKHPRHWTAREVLDWLYSAADQHGLDGSKLRGEAFQTIRGSELCRMSLEDFIKAEPEFGDLYYQVFQNLLNSVGQHSGSTPSPLSQFTELDISTCLAASSPDPMDMATSYTPKTHSQAIHPARHTIQMPTSVGYSYPYIPSSSSIDTTTESHRHIDSCMEQEKARSQNSAISGGVNIKCELDPYTNYPLTDPNPNSFPGSYYSQPAPMIPFSSQSYMPSVPHLMHNFPSECEKKRDKGPGRYPRDHHIGLPPRRPPKRPRGSGKNQLLWEFIYDTLMNPRYSPQYLRWENKQDGIFRFVQSEAVAQLWGSLKNNDNMTYEKLSRAMRHYYKRGILERVEGRRLVYKFSQKALETMRRRVNSV